MAEDVDDIAKLVIKTSAEETRVQRLEKYFHSGTKGSSAKTEHRGEDGKPGSESGPARTKKKSREVLEEDEYVQRLGKIIRRDFYPELHRLYDKADEHASTSDRMGVDEFLEKYTSEDNAHFEKLHHKDRLEHRKKYWWAFQPSESNTGNQFLRLGMDRPSSSMPLMIENDRANRIEHEATRLQVPEKNETQSEARTETTSVAEAPPTVNGYTFVTRSSFKLQDRSSRETRAHDLARLIELRNRKRERGKKVHGPPSAEGQDRPNNEEGKSREKRLKMLSPMGEKLAKQMFG